jgi:hypothetical protein
VVLRHGGRILECPLHKPDGDDRSVVTASHKRPTTHSDDRRPGRRVGRPLRTAILDRPSGSGCLDPATFRSLLVPGAGCARRRARTAPTTAAPPCYLPETDIPLYCFVFQLDTSGQPTVCLLIVQQAIAKGQLENVAPPGQIRAALRSSHALIRSLRWTEPMYADDAISSSGPTGRCSVGPAASG